MTGPFDLNTVNTFASFAQADAQVSAIRAEELYVYPHFQVVMYDNAYQPLFEIADYLSCEVEFKRNAVGSGTLVLKGSDLAGVYANNCMLTVIGVTVQVNELRWSGRVFTCEYADVAGIQTYTLQLESDYRWFSRMLVWPNFLLPLELQWPTSSVFVGQAITNLKELISEQCIRLQLGLWEIVNNILDPLAWFATTMVDEGLLTPIAVVPSDPLTDTSPWIAVTCKMDTVETIAEQILKATGLILTADLWLPGDPQPNGLVLSVPTIVVDVVDKSGVTGPTGTFLDGLIIDVAGVLQGAYEEAAGPLTGSGFLPPGVVIEPALGVNWTPPWVIYYPDNNYSGVKEVHITPHSPLSFTTVSGGKSPQWVNDLINLALEALMSGIIGAIATIPFLTGIAAAAGVADNLLDGLFNDTILAYDGLENAPRRVKLGTYGYPEFPTGIGSTAWTLSSAMGLLNGQWDTRGYVSFQMIVTDEFPYQFGRDFGLGDLVSWIHAGIRYTDYCDSVKATDSRDERWVVTAQIGDGQGEESPFAVLQRRIAGAQAALQVALMSSN